MQIKEVEKRTDLTAKSIRLYEEKGLIEIERNKDNSYREYSKENIDVLKEIKVLRYLDFSILHIKELLVASPKVTKEALENKEHEYQCEIEDYNMKIRICNLLKKNCSKKGSIKQVLQEYEELIPHLENVVEEIQEISRPSLLETIGNSLLYLGIIIWLVANMVDKKWSVLYYTIPIGLIATVFLISNWNKYFSHRK
ncbi:MAG: MerR family transcriptional regulator [Lachnotalea sp.]